MFAPPAPEERDIILSLIAHTSDGVTLDRIAQSFSPAEDQRKLKQWLEDFANENLTFMAGEGRSAVYLAVDPAALLTAYPVAPGIASRSSGAGPASGAGPSAQVPATDSAVAQPVPAPAPAPEPAIASSLGGVAPSDPDFPKMLDLAIPVLVSTPLDRQGTIVTLRTHAARNGKTGRGIGAYVNYALSRLDHLTAADADAYGLTAEEFSVWQTRYTAAPRAATAATPAVAPTPTAVEPAPDKRFAAPIIVPAPASPTAATVAATTSPMNELQSALTVASLGVAIRKLAADVVWKTLLPRCKDMIHPKRLMIAWVWGVILITLLGSYARYRVYYLVMIPLVGAPWGWFIYRQKGRASTVEDVCYAILLGGILTFFLASFASQLLRWGAAFGG